MIGPSIGPVILQLAHVALIAEFAPRPTNHFMQKGTTQMAGNMIESLVNSFGGPVLEDLGKRVGLPTDVVKQATPLVTGLVVTGIARLAKQEGGSQKVGNLLQSAGDRMGGRDLDTFVKEADPAKTGEMLQALAGSNSVENLTANIAKKTGLPADSVGQLLGVMAPAVVGQMGTMAKEQGLDAAGITKLIDDNTDALKGIGDLDTLLDNVPGISDDIKRGISKLFGG